MQEAAADYSEKDGVLFGQVNGYKEKAISERFGVKGHPTFKWFARGSTEASPFYFVHYSGGYHETLIKMASARRHAVRRRPMISTTRALSLVRGLHHAPAGERAAKQDAR